MKISSKLNELKPTDLNCNVFDVYSYDGLSMQELLCQFFTKINECIKVSNETIDLASWLVNEGLKIEVVKKLMLWLEDGTLENLINVNLFNSLNTKIENINSQLAHVENKTFINIKDFGVIGDGVTDNTEDIQKVFDYAKANSINKIFIPDGYYIIDGVDKVSPYYHSGGIFIDFPIEVELSKNAILRVKQNDSIGYNIFSIHETENVYIHGGKLEGDLLTHDVNTGGEFGFGIYIKGCKNIIIENMSIGYMWGDSIIIDPIVLSKVNGVEQLKGSENIVIKNNLLHNNRRQGISSCFVDGLHIEGNKIYNIGALKGTSPKSGIDIEGYPYRENGVFKRIISKSTNINIKNNVFNSNVNSDLILAESVENVIVCNNIFNSINNSINITSFCEDGCNVLIQNNVFNGDERSNNGISTYPNSLTNLIIDSNIFKNFKYDEFSCGVKYGGKLIHNKILNNVFENCSVGITREADTINSMVVSNNIFKNISSIGIRYANTKKCLYSTFNNNIFEQCKTGMNIGSSKGDISNNKFKSCETCIFLGFYVDGLNINNNIFDGFTNKGVEGYNASTNCFINSNIFYNDNNSIKAIRITSTPIDGKTIVTNNVALYGNTSVIDLDSNCISNNNLTL